MVKVVIILSLDAYILDINILVWIILINGLYAK
jgi:hypothetical protein